MKNSEFLIFFGIVFIVYTAINYYIFIRGSQVLNHIENLKNIYYILFFLLYVSFFLHLFITRFNPSGLSNIISFIGNIWLGAILYFFLAVILIDVLRFVNYLLPFFPSVIYKNYETIKIFTFGVVSVSVVITLIFGFINAKNPQLKKINIPISKKVEKYKKLRIVAATDVHLRSLCSNGFTKELVRRINSLNPDLVLFPGDLLDEAIEPVLKFKTGEPLRDIKSKFGVYAVTGNHEYIGGINKTADYIESLGIILLRDSVTMIGNEVYLIGREDRAIKQFAKKQRKPLNKIIEGIDKTKPLILLDHQPIGLREAERNGIDFQLSGHTHYGQLLPIGYITDLIYEISWGFLKKGKTQYYVSCGYGTWGPPIRIGNKPELLLLELQFMK